MRLTAAARIPTLTRLLVPTTVAATLLAPAAGPRAVADQVPTAAARGTAAGQVPALGTRLKVGPLRGCDTWRGTIAGTSRRYVFAYTVRGRCYGKRIRLRFRQSFKGRKYWGSGRVFGRKVHYSGRIAESRYRRTRLTVAGRNLSRYGDGAWNIATTYDHSSLAGFSLGDVSFYCIHTALGANGRWAVRMFTMPIGASHYHNTPTRRQRRGLPFALCATLLQAGDNLLPTNR